MAPSQRDAGAGSTGPINLTALVASVEPGTPIAVTTSTPGLVEHTARLTEFLTADAVNDDEVTAAKVRLVE